ncbi:hypothetical protein SAMN05216275_16212 [Streptosporangium canum]|uniref:ESAT-6-like protein n=1 Tax=Streptosporangium canum TaxID=324952 RepID=A0A1I4FHC0_9ACTN|nr:hypothetical protein [Streptosporangium canum]SFL16206.1 hypothetical protein SAMN05216275_16212 [Streptosporangium canum]
MNNSSNYTMVSHVQMENTRIALLKVVTEMDQATDDLVTRLKTTLGGLWSGKTAEYFEAHRMIWDDAEREMGRRLHEAATAIGVANENYKNAELKNQRIWMQH